MPFSTIISKMKFSLWKVIYTPYYRIKYSITYPQRKRLNILNSEETIRYIIDHNCSVSRFGDGEFQMIYHYLNHLSTDSFNVDTFQNYNLYLAEKLLTVLKSKQDNVLICIPYPFKSSKVYKGYIKTFFEREWLYRKEFIIQLNGTELFGDSCFTRFYMGRKDISNIEGYIKLLQKMWNNRDVIIVEGQQSRLGVGNGLFGNSKSLKRILCPPTNAFEKYDIILNEIEKVASDSLLLLALGQTATILSYDLAMRGFQAIDLGHIDIEYEWFKMKATKKVPVKNKYVNEVQDGRINTRIDDSVYAEQIISVIE